MENPQNTTGNRKDDHLRLATGQHEARPADNEFDNVAFVHHALAGIDSAAVSLATDFAGFHWSKPLFVNAMTGGSPRAGAVNRDLAIAARETGIPLASGSLSAFFADPDTADTFRVLRRENPDGFLMANINATTSVDNARRAVDLLSAQAVQIHLNAVQEIVMPEGDRSFGSWPGQIARIAAGVEVPVIVKEVGFGLSRTTVCQLEELGVAVADVAGRGGTNFAQLENDRRPGRDFAFLQDWGQSTAACLLALRGVSTIPVLASGGIRHPLDIARSLALGAVGVGVSGRFLHTLVTAGLPALIDQITTWLEQLVSLMTILGAPTPTALTTCDLTLTGPLEPRHL